jgi:hypothetical protein
MEKVGEKKRGRNESASFMKLTRNITIGTAILNLRHGIPKINPTGKALKMRLE